MQVRAPAAVLIALAVPLLGAAAVLHVLGGGEAAGGGQQGDGSSAPSRPDPTTGRPPEERAPRTSVAAHGAVGDGTTDDTEAFVDAIGAAASSDGRLYVPPGTYVISDALELPAAVTDVELAAGAVVRQTVDEPAFVRQGRIVAGPLATTGARAGADEVVVTGAEGRVAAGDWMVLASSRRIPTSERFDLGSLRRATAVDGDRVELDRPLVSDLDHDTTGWLMELAPPVRIEGGVVEHAHPEDAFRPLVLLAWVEGPELDGTEIRSCGGSGVKTVGTVGGALDVYVHDCLDDHAGERFHSGRHYGYGVEVTGPTRDLVVTGRSHSVRHAFTTNGSYPDVDERLVNVGEPEDVDVSMDVWDTTSSGLDTHELGVDVRFHDCVVRDAGRYAREGSDDSLEGGFGIFIRAPRTIVERCVVTGAAVTGLVVAEPIDDLPPWGPERRAVVRDTVIEATRGRAAVYLKQPALLQDVRISGSHRYGVEFFDAGERSTVRGSTIRLDGPHQTFAFANPGDARLVGNQLRTDAERLG